MLVMPLLIPLVSAAGSSGGGASGSLSRFPIPSPPPLVAFHASGGVGMLGYQLDAIQDCRFRAAADVTAELGEGWEHRRCHPVCPKLAPPAQEQHCSEAHHETPYAEHHNGVHFTILFLAMCLTVGALSALCIPKWIPYTVTILMLGIFVGIAAFFAETAPTCPMNAL